MEQGSQGIDSPISIRPRGIGHGTLFTNAVAYLFYCLMPLFFDIHWHGLENYHAYPSTLITINHRRDFDTMLVPAVLHIKRTVFHDRLRMYFIARDDLFEPGYLTGHVAVKFPWPIGNLVHKVNLAPIVGALSAYPLSGVINKRFSQLIFEIKAVAGDMRLADAVKQDYLVKLSAETGVSDVTSTGDLSLTQVMSYKYRSLHDRFIDTGVLKDGLARRVREYSLKQVESQLQLFARILRDGGVCLLAPEGRLSQDGRFWPVKSGLYRLVSLAGTEVTVLPVNTTYDFMTTGRRRVHIGVGEEIRLAMPLGKVATERRVQQAIIGQTYVTMGQIGSEYFLQRLESGGEGFGEQELAEALTARAEVLKNTGLNLDERLTSEKGFRRRLRQFVRYCVRHRILLEPAPRRYAVNPRRSFKPLLGELRQDPVLYSYNELKTLLEHSGVGAEPGALAGTRL